MKRYQRRHGGFVAVGDQALESLISLRQMSAQAPEGGGVLLGRLILHSNDVVIDEITHPGPADARGRYWFKRSQKTAQPRVVEAWNQSSGTRIYLGDWHSHPEDDPTPSSVDIQDWKNTLTRAVYEQDFLLFAIVGRRSISFWEGRRSSGRETIWPLTSDAQLHGDAEVGGSAVSQPPAPEAN